MAFIKPEIFTDIVTEKIKGKVVASPIASNIGNDTVSPTSPDNTPRSSAKFEAIGEAKELTKGQGIDEAELKQVDSKATIKQVAAPGVSESL